MSVTRDAMRVWTCLRERGTKTAFLPVRDAPYEPGVYLQSQQKHALLGHGGKVIQMSFRGVPSSRYGGDGSD